MARLRLGFGLFLLFFVLLPWGAAWAESASSDIQLILEGKRIAPDVPPIIEGGRLLVPIRFVAEGLGAKVEWHGDEKKIAIRGDSLDLAMWVGKKTALVNGKEVALDVPPAIEGDRTLVPLRFVGEAMGVAVGWDESSRGVIINRKLALKAGGQQLAGEKVFFIDGEFYLPLKTISPYIGAVYQPSEGGSGDRLIYRDLRLELDEKAQAEWKLRKIDGSWMIPLSVLEKRFPVAAALDGGEISVERIGELQSVAEVDGKIRIQTTLPVEARHFLLDNPNRLVIDLPNTAIGEPLRQAAIFREDGTGILPRSGMGNEGSSSSPEGLIREIRFSQFSLVPQTVRLVAELTQPVDYAVHLTEEGLEVTLEPRAEAVPSPEPGFLPEPVPAPDPWSLPEEGTEDGFLVFLDPGHGGKDPGATGVSGNLEKDFTLSISRLLKEELMQYEGIEVMESRTGDTYPTLQERVQMANDAQADVFLSIHANSFKPQTRGTETYYHTPQSEELAKIVHRHLVSATKFPDRGVKQAGFYVIKNAAMPAVLVEIGFLTNEEENKRMLDPEFQQSVAKELGKAIYEYYISTRTR